VLYYLSGLTCSDENARTKAHFATEAAKLGLAVVFPDTSPRPEVLCHAAGAVLTEAQVAIEGQDDSWDFGSSAGFYVDATVPKWSKHYNMYTYITKELPELISGLFPVDPVRRSITGHSMGGHGALVAHLRNPGMFASVSAFAPICNPTAVPWGEKAFTGYLGSVEAGKAYDATELVASYAGPKVEHFFLG
jgi:S-formylglutathione hydrolase